MYGKCLYYSKVQFRDFVHGKEKIVHYWALLIHDIKPELSLHNDNKDDMKGTTEGKRRLYL